MELEFQSTSDMQCGSWLLKELYVAVVVILAFFHSLAAPLLELQLGTLSPALQRWGNGRGQRMVSYIWLFLSECSTSLL